MKNKLWGFYAKAILSNLLFFLPIYSIVFYESLNFTLTQIGILIAINPLSTLIFEVPTGIFADKIGRKNSTILGYSILALCYICIFFIHRYWFFILMNVLIGLGVSFFSGATQAWISDLVPEKKLSSFFANIQSIDNAAILVSGFLAVVIVSLYGLNSIWLAAAFSYAMGALMFSFVPASNKSSKKAVTFSSYISHLKDAIQIIKKNNHLLKLVLAFGVLGLAYSFATNLAWIPFLEQIGYDANKFGYVWSLMAAMGVVAPFLGQWLRKKFSDLVSMRILIVLLSIAFFCVLFAHSIWMALLLLVITLLFDHARIPLETAYFQLQLSKEKKATITSLQSLLLSLGLIVGYPLVGLIADTFSSRIVLVIAGFLFLPLIWFYSDK